MNTVILYCVRSLIKNSFLNRKTSIVSILLFLISDVKNRGWNPETMIDVVKVVRESKIVWLEDSIKKPTKLLELH